MYGQPLVTIETDLATSLWEITMVFVLEVVGLSHKAFLVSLINVPHLNRPESNLIQLW